MINRENWQDVRAYLGHLRNLDRDEEGIHCIRSWLRHLLEWADDKPLGNARQIDPSFQTYLLTARADGKVKRLSAVTMKRCCDYARIFLRWARGNYPTRYRQVSENWIETIRPSAARGIHSEFREHQFYTLEQIQRIAALEPPNLRVERDQAAVCFLFLSAMRSQAFVSLPIGAVDLERYVVDQFPELGVRTKNRKAARTQLLRIPDLLAVVRGWDARMHEAGLGQEDLWFPAIDHWHRRIIPGSEMNWLSRRALLADGLRDLCALAGVPYLSLHKLRHGHAVYVMRRVKDMKQLKSLSQNLMHSSVAITDGIYARLVSDDIADMYEDLGR